MVCMQDMCGAFSMGLHQIMKHSRAFWRKCVYLYVHYYYWGLADLGSIPGQSKNNRCPGLLP